MISDLSRLIAAILRLLIIRRWTKSISSKSLAITCWNNECGWRNWINITSVNRAGWNAQRDSTELSCFDGLNWRREPWSRELHAARCNRRRWNDLISNNDSMRVHAVERHDIRRVAPWKTTFTFSSFIFMEFHGALGRTMTVGAARKITGPLAKAGWRLLVRNANRKARWLATIRADRLAV